MCRDKLGAAAVKFRLTDSVHFEDRTVMVESKIHMEQIVPKSLSGTIAGSSVGMPSASCLFCNAGANWGGPKLVTFSSSALEFHGRF